MKSKECVIFLATPIGKLRILHTDVGVKEIKLDQEYDNHKEIIGHEYKDLNVSELSCDGPRLKSVNFTLDWMKSFFSGQNKPGLEKLPPIDNDIYTRNNFIGRVLRTLAADIGPGETISYAELAKLCDSPKACRAVGQAMRANPVPLIVPCHRVISSDGKSGHYMSGKGDNIKKWLIGLEQTL